MVAWSFFALVGLFSPRLALVLLWLLTDWVGQAFDRTIWALVGLLFLPWTTICYVLVARNGEVMTYGWLLVALGLFVDLGGT